MSYKAYRLRQRKSDGSYDIILLASRSDLSIRFNADGTEKGTVEQGLITLEAAVNSLTTTVNDIDLTTKVNKIGDGVIGNFPSITTDGQLTDSGTKASDFAAASHEQALGTITGTANSVVIVGSNGKLTVASGITPTDLSKLTGITSSVQEQIDAVVQTANQAKTAANGAIANTEKGTAGGVVPLNSQGLIDTAYLPSFVDDVIEGYYSGGKFYKEAAHTTEITGETGKIYVDLSTEKTYRWSGSAYVVISETIALGETSSTAYRGDRGKVAYDHSQAAHARTDATCVKYVSNGVISINGTNTTVYTHPTYTATKATTSSTITAGGTFKALTAMTNTNGHVTGYTETTFTMPAAGCNVQSGTGQPTNQATGDLWFETLS